MLDTLLHTHIAAALLAFTPPAPTLGAYSLTPWHDPSPHQIVHVQVSPAVQLEVLDWGGPGTPLIFLAGGGESSHVYDSFAPRFTDRFHVLGIIRRGVGTSSHPNTGYDTTSLVRDIVAIMDSLGLKAASFVGHSFAASELNALAVRYPERIDRLVYLDAAFDFRALVDSPEWKNGLLSSPQPPTPAYDDNSVASWTLWAERVSGPGYPEAAVRALYQFGPDGQFLRSLSIDSVIKRLTEATEADGTSSGSENLRRARAGPHSSRESISGSSCQRPDRDHPRGAALHLLDRLGRNRPRDAREFSTRNVNAS